MSAVSNAATTVPCPTVCVIIVAYNAGSYLGACIESLRRQSWTDFEAIIVDNGSTDGSIEALGQLQAPFRLLAAGEVTSSVDAQASLARHPTPA